MPRWLWILFAVGLIGWWASPPMHLARARPVGVLAADPPQQVDLAHGQMFAVKDFEITPLADFELTARVLARADYRFDPAAALSPTDLALGWGRMSDTAVLDKLQISQSSRWYTYRSGNGGWPIPLDEIIRSSSNMHMIPADTTIAATLLRVRPGDMLHLRGELIQARRGDGSVWRSSLSRTDTGDGACEVVWVQALDVL